MWLANRGWHGNGACGKSNGCREEDDLLSESKRGSATIPTG